MNLNYNLFVVVILLLFNKTTIAIVNTNSNSTIEIVKQNYTHNHHRLLLTSTKFSPVCETNVCGNYYCNTNSNCVNGKCICKRGYASHVYEIFQCCYVQKYQFTAFFLELFISFGIGHLYIGSNIIGSIKLVIFSLFCIVICFIFIYWNKKDIQNERLNPNTEYYTSIIFVGSSSTCIFMYVTWQIIDIIMFSLN